MRLATSLALATLISAIGSAVVACGTLLGTSDGSIDSPPIAVDAAEAADGPAPPPDARADADADTGIADAPMDVVDAGCGAVIATDFSSAVLPPQAMELKDVGSTLVYDMTGVGGTRAMHLTVPDGNTTAGLLINLQALGRDGAQACAVSCAFDIKLLRRGTAAVELTMQGGVGAPSANVSHNSTFTYFSRSGNLVEAPDLGPLGNGGFTRVKMDVSPGTLPVTGRVTVGGATDTKDLAFFPEVARIGIEKIAASLVVEAIIDNVVCRSRLP